MLVFVNVCVFSEIIDLSDESGNVKNLLEHKSEYATEILKARHSFILIRVDSEYYFYTFDMFFIFTPLLHTKMIYLF